MKSSSHPVGVFRIWAGALATLAILVALILPGQAARAQTSSATLDGTVFDVSGAIVPGATVTLRNQASGDERGAVSNGAGFFSFAAVPPGNYSLAVERQGFARWVAKGIVLSSGDHRSASEIKLKVGAKEETVTVEATSSDITPTDTGDKSFTIGENIMQNVAIIGQNAAEFIKIMPGMAMNAGALNQSSYAASDERTGSGPVGSFSANGQRQGALDITSDGAHIIDPGCNCGQAENTNAEMTSEVTVMTSNFGAESAKGPVVINTVGKSGGQQFHGELYTYNRYYSMNANDWLGNAAGTDANGKQIAPRPQTKYWYPGGQISGPVIIPGTNFNHNRDKLFFFFGTELYRQDVDNGIYHAVVPTQAMRNGDFTDPLISKLNGYAVTGKPNGGGPNHDGYNNGMVNAARIDPNGKALMNVYPLNNADPTISTNQGYNYIKALTRSSNMNQYRGRLDYSINNSTKLYVQYNHQNDSAEESLDTLWTGNAQSWDDPTTPYPTPIVETSQSEVVTANMTKVFTPTLTNEVIFNYVYLNLPNSFKDPSKVSRDGLGLTYTQLFSHPDPGKIIYPEMTGWGDGISNQLNSGFELNGTVYAKKTLPSVADNISKVWRTHTAKFGFYWERTWNEQPGNGNVNGTAVFSNWGTNSTGNAYADMLIGQATNYQEQNFNVVPAFRYISTEFYGQDSWKVSRKVTLDLGMRVSHLGPWVDTTGYGFAAWYPNLYNQGTGGTVAGATFPGILWNKVHSGTPLSGSASRLAFINPRVGFAWDLYGQGKTILRGGYGIYHFHDEQNVQNGAYGIVRGSFGSPTINPTNCGSAATPCNSSQWSGRMADLNTLASYGQGLSIPNGVTALDPNDDQEPQTQDWSLTLAQRAPWKSLVEIAYVGNKSDYLSNYNNNFYQINDITIGNLFAKNGWMPDCYPAGQATDGGKCGASGADTGFSSAATQAARPLSAYATLKIINHHMYSNYNALQMTWNKQQGHLTWLANYTYSKALGIRGENGAATGDPTDLKNNYGTLPNDRTHIFNIAYIYQFPSLSASSNAIARGFANGWQISGITQYQTGADLQAAVTANFGYSAYIPGGTTFMGKTIEDPVKASNQNTLGTPDINLQPKLICSPNTGLKKNQYINGACFSPFVTPGEQGSYIFPTMHGPGFANSDVSVFKNFVFGASESKKLQFRFSGYNFLNHPVRTFNGNADPGLSLQFDSTGKPVDVGGAPFGYASNKTGHRIIQLEGKFSF
jgi:Carboxypeptidase regulatory-like domain